MTTVNTLDVSFGSQNVVDILTLLDQSGANPYVIGTTHDGTHKVNMDIGHFCVYKKALSTADHSELMTTVNTTVSEVFTDATIYKVTASGGKFYIDGVENPSLTHENGKYVFDQSDTSNTSHPLRLSETENGTGGEYITRVFKNGTPGSLNAYTFINATGGVPSLYYYCTNHLGMGNAFIASVVPEQIKVVQNILGESVFAIGDPLTNTFYNQPDLSFNTGDRVTYNLSHSSMSGHNVVFGTEVDNSSTIISSSYVTVTGTPGSEDATLTLDLTEYSGDAVYYFEDTSANMGYNVFQTSSNTDSITTPYTYINPPNTQRSSSANWPNLNNSVLQDNTNVNVCWAAPDTDYNPQEWVKINLLSDVLIAGVILQPRNVFGQQVEQFKVEYSSDDITYHKVDNDKNFGAIYSTLASEYYRSYTYFLTPVIAQYIKIIPTAHKSWISLLAGLIQGTLNSVSITKIVTVSGSPEVFYLDGVATPDITFTTGETYKFDQSDSSNDGNQLVFGTVPELTSNILGTTDGVTIVGTPGQPGAYTQFTVSSSSSLYYYSFSTQNMGQLAVDTHYYVKAVQNILGDTVFAISTTENGTYYNQMDLSFNAGDKVLFHTSDSSMDGYNLTFGTQVNNSGTVVNSSYVIVSDAGVLLNLTDYTGDAVYYFEDTSANMGYTEYSTEAVQVTVSGSPSVFYLDGVATPDISLNSDETYIFDQSDSSNDGNQFVLGTVSDNNTNIVSDDMTIFGTPGQPGAYMIVNLSSSYDSLFYYSFSNTNMGGNIDYTGTPAEPLLTESYIIGTSNYETTTNKTGSPVTFTMRDTGGSPTTIYIKFKAHTDSTLAYLLDTPRFNGSNAARWGRLIVTYKGDTKTIDVLTGSGLGRNPYTLTTADNALIHLFIKYRSNSTIMVIYNDNGTQLYTKNLNQGHQDSIYHSPSDSFFQRTFVGGNQPHDNDIDSFAPSSNASIYYINIYDKYTTTSDDQSLITYVNTVYTSEVSMENFTPV
jgi:hypothetical protein